MQLKNKETDESKQKNDETDLFLELDALDALIPTKSIAQTPVKTGKIN